MWTHTGREEQRALRPGVESACSPWDSWITDSQLTLGVNVCVNGCLSKVLAL